jgi:hypothetical protein
MPNRAQIVSAKRSLPKGMPRQRANVAGRIGIDVVETAP